MAKNPKSPAFTSPVAPTTLNTSIGSTGASEKSCPSKTEFFQPANFGKPDDWMIKSRPKGLKICRHDHKVLVNISTEGIDESLHGLGEIEEFSSNNGVFLEREKL